MRFFYHTNSGDEILTINSELHKYIFKVRRHNKNEDLFFRNLKDKNIYKYEVVSINRRDTTLRLLDFEEKIVEPSKKLHIGWCIIDPKTIEKFIAPLNELGVTKITFIPCRYSQHQFKPNLEKLNKLLVNSSSQSGRSSIIQLDTIDSLDSFLKQNPQSYMFNFSNNTIDNCTNKIDTIILGCEGGFSQDEIDMFDTQKIVGIKSNLILRSETAAVTIASKILV